MPFGGWSPRGAVSSDLQLAEIGERISDTRHQYSTDSSPDGLQAALRDVEAGPDFGSFGDHAVVLDRQSGRYVVGSAKQSDRKNDVGVASQSVFSRFLMAPFKLVPTSTYYRFQ